MKRGLILASVAGLAIAAGSASAQVYASETVPVTINDNSEFGDVITVTGGPASITDVNVVMRITHTYCADLDIILQGPAGSYICLSTDSGGGGDNFNTIRFEDAAPTSVTNGVAPFNDNFRPEGLVNGYNGFQAFPAGTGLASMAGFNGGASNGNWTLWVADDAGADTGTLDYWSLEFNGAVDTNGPAPATAPTNPSGTGSLSVGVASLGDTVNFRVAVTPGANPTSTGLSVRMDGSQINLGSALQLFDDGNHNDGSAGDGTFGLDVVIPNDASSGTYSIPFTIADAQNRSTSDIFPNLQVVGNAPGCPEGTNPVSFSNIGSNEGQGDPSNQVLDITWPSGQVINAIHVSGRLVSQAAFTYASEARFAVHYANGAVDIIQPFTQTGAFTVADASDFIFTLPTPRSSAGVTIEAFESFNDVIGSDSTWSGLCFTFDPQLTPTDPTGVGGPAAGAVDQTANLRVVVTPGAVPTSTFAAPTSGVTVDASSINLGSVQLYDDGNHNDGAANDLTYAADVVIPNSVAAGTYTLSFNVRDDQSRNGSGTWDMAVENLAGQIPGQPIVPQGSGALTSITEDSADGTRSYLYQIDICDPSNFSASTVGATSPVTDTQLFLFDETGKGVLHNDDVVGGATNESELPAGYVSSPGTYYLALSFYNRDPITSSGGFIWANTPFRAVRTPDGTDPASAITGWTGAGFGTAAITINMTGACYPSNGPACNPDYNDDGNADQDDISYLVNVVAGGANPLNKDPDFNRDGNADQDDIALLVGVIAGSPCPL